MHTAPTAATTNAAAAHKPILAERFKTKLCRTFCATGECPYEHRCMFAHGEHELRTKEMNLRDGLVTEEAVKAFQQRYKASAAQQRKAAAAHVAAAPPIGAPIVAAARPRAVPVAPKKAVPQPPAAPQTYRHEPYAAHVVAPTPIAAVPLYPVAPSVSPASIAYTASAYEEPSYDYDYGYEHRAAPYHRGGYDVDASPYAAYNTYGSTKAVEEDDYAESYGYTDGRESPVSEGSNAHAAAVPHAHSHEDFDAYYHDGHYASDGEASAIYA